MNDAMNDDLKRPSDAPADWPGAMPTATTTGQHGGQSDTSTTATVGDMNAIQRLLAGTNWTHEDVNLALSALSTLIFLYWAYTEMR